MIDTVIVIVIAILLVSAIVWFGRNGASLPRPFNARACEGASWRRAFPGASKESIRSFLTIFVDAFAFDDRQRLKFKPDDTILGVYRAMYTTAWLPDALEMETLASSIEKTYGVRFSEVWREGLTLGELFSAAQGIENGR